MRAGGGDRPACKNVKRANALDYVLGYTCANDVSARDWQIKKRRRPVVPRQDLSTRSAPLGPCLVTDAMKFPNPTRWRIRTVLNGEVVQDWNTNDMIFDVPR